MSKVKSKEIKIELDGLMSRTLCSNIATELVKYILSQRDQIPHNFDAVELKSSITSGNKHADWSDQAKSITQKIPSSLEAPNGECSEEQTEKNLPLSSYQHISLGDDRKLCSTQCKTIHKAQYYSRPDLPRPLRPSERKKVQCIQALTEIVENIQKVFMISEYPIQKLAVLLGTSLITPRETFVLAFPSNWIEGQSLASESVKKHFFRQLVLSDFIESFSSNSAPPLRKAFILIQTWRQPKLAWFEVAPKFTIPKRGDIYHINIENQPVESDSLLVRGSGSSLDMSGIQVLDSSVVEGHVDKRLRTSDFGRSPLSMHISHRNSTEIANSTPQRDFNIDNSLDVTIEEMEDMEDWIWYKAPLAFKGFR